MKRRTTEKQALTHIDLRARTFTRYVSRVDSESEESFISSLVTKCWAGLTSTALRGFLNHYRTHVSTGASITTVTLLIVMVWPVKPAGRNLSVDLNEHYPTTDTLGLPVLSGMSANTANPTIFTNQPFLAQPAIGYQSGQLGVITGTGQGSIDLNQLLIKGAITTPSVP
jgi:hypothetical protein